MFLFISDRYVTLAENSVMMPSKSKFLSTVSFSMLKMSNFFKSCAAYFIVIFYQFKFKNIVYLEATIDGTVKNHVTDT